MPSKPPISKAQKANKAKTTAKKLPGKIAARWKKARLAAMEEDEAWEKLEADKNRKAKEKKKTSESESESTPSLADWVPIIAGATDNTPTPVPTPNPTPNPNPNPKPKPNSNAPTPKSIAVVKQKGPSKGLSKRMLKVKMREQLM